MDYQLPTLITNLAAPHSVYIIENGVVPVGGVRQLHCAVAHPPHLPDGRPVRVFSRQEIGAATTLRELPVADIRGEWH